MENCFSLLLPHVGDNQDGGEEPTAGPSGLCRKPFPASSSNEPQPTTHENLGGIPKECGSSKVRDQIQPDTQNLEEEEEGNCSELEEPEYAGSGDSLRQHGMQSKYSITVQIQPGLTGIQENVDNTDIINTLDELHKLLSAKFQPAVAEWILVMFYYM